MLRIGEFSKMTKVTIKTLRYYDEIDLLKPEVIDELTGYRMYTTKQLYQLHQIQSLRQIGISINETKQILARKIDLKDVLLKRKQVVLQELDTVNDNLSRIEFILTGKEEETMKNYQAVLKELPECNVYSATMVLPSYEDYPKYVPPLGAKVIKQYPDLKCITPEYCFVRYLDGEYKDKDINIEYLEAVDQLKPNFDNIVFKKIPSVLAVCVMHKGPYSSIGNAYAYLIKWLEESEYEMIDVPRESYIDGVWNKDSQEDWLTELQMPVVKKEASK